MHESVSTPAEISVVVPFFNSGRTLAACIDSLLAQEGITVPYEILLVDNRSQDDSAEIAGRYPEVMLLAESEPGAYAARNTAIRRATGSVIALTDADCVVDRDWLRQILEGLQDPRTAALIGHCRYPPEASWPLHLLGAYENAKARYVVEQCPPANHFAYANNMAVRAEVFAELGLFETWPRAADSELVHRLATRRPDLRFRFLDTMRITHLEFVRGRDRAKRLHLYQSTNARIPTFRELRPRQRLGVLAELLRRRV